jgi:hypothetical protein
MRAGDGGGFFVKSFRIALIILEFQQFPPQFFHCNPGSFTLRKSKAGMSYVGVTASMTFYDKWN